MSVPLPDAEPTPLTALLDALVYAAEARVRAPAERAERCYAAVVAAREAIERVCLPVAA